MIIKFTLRMEDMRESYKRYLKDYNFLFKWYSYIIVIALAFILRAFYGPNQYTSFEKGIAVKTQDTNFWVDIIINLTYLTILLFIARYIFTIKAIKHLRNNPQLFGEKELELNDDALIVRSKSTKTEYTFPALKNISEGKYHYFIFFKGKQLPFPVSKRNENVSEFIFRLGEKI